MPPSPPPPPWPPWLEGDSAAETLTRPASAITATSLVAFSGGRALLEIRELICQVSQHAPNVSLRGPETLFLSCDAVK